MHLHIPKTGGTNFNLQLAFIAAHLEEASAARRAAHPYSHTHRARAKGTAHRGPAGKGKPGDAALGGGTIAAARDEALAAAKAEEQARLLPVGSYCEVSTTDAHLAWPAALLDPFGPPLQLVLERDLLAKRNSGGGGGASSPVAGAAPGSGAGLTADETAGAAVSGLVAAARASLAAWWAGLHLGSGFGGGAARVLLGAASTGTTTSVVPATPAALAAAAASSQMGSTSPASASYWWGLSGLFSRFGGGSGSGPPPQQPAACSVVSGEHDASILRAMADAFRGRGVAAAVSPGTATPSAAGSDLDGELGEDELAGEGGVPGAEEHTQAAKSKSKALVALQGMVLLRDPIARAVSQFEHHLSRQRYGGGAGGAAALDMAARRTALLAAASPSLCSQLEMHPGARCVFVCVCVCMCV